MGYNLTETLGDSFKLLPGFISKEKANSMYLEFKKRVEEVVSVDENCFKSDETYRNAYGEHQTTEGAILLCNKLKDIIEITKEPCLPTFSFSRAYGRNGELMTHLDRRACEISVTIHLGGDKEWEFGIQSLDNSIKFINLEPGDAVLFDGVRNVHARKGKYKGQLYVNLFLHYVYAYGPNKECSFEMPGIEEAINNPEEFFRKRGTYIMKH